MTNKTVINAALKYLTNHTIEETSERYAVSPSTIFNWKKRYMNATGSVQTKPIATDRKKEIIKQIHDLTTELGVITYKELTRAA